MIGIQNWRHMQIVSLQISNIWIQSGSHGALASGIPCSLTTASCCSPQPAHSCNFYFYQWHLLMTNLFTLSLSRPVPCHVMPPPRVFPFPAAIVSSLFKLQNVLDLRQQSAKCQGSSLVVKSRFVCRTSNYNFSLPFQLQCRVRFPFQFHWSAALWSIRGIDDWLIFPYSSYTRVSWTN